MPNIRIKNIIPNTQIFNTIPNTQVSSFQTGRAGEVQIASGTPIGLLLALTYAEITSLPSFGDFRPNTRIINN